METTITGSYNLPDVDLDLCDKAVPAQFRIWFVHCLRNNEVNVTSLGCKET